MFAILFIIIYLPFAILVANEGKKKSIGFGLTLGISLIFSPLIGYLAVSFSDEKKSTFPPHKVKRLLGESAEEREDYEEASRLYKESLAHLENDYKGIILPSHQEKKRLEYLSEIKVKIKNIDQILVQ